MRLYATAERVEVEQDERGFDLRVTTEDGDDFLFNIQNVVLEFTGSKGFKDLIVWAAEGRHGQQLLRAHLKLLEPDGLHSVSVDRWPGER